MKLRNRLKLSLIVVLFVIGVCSSCSQTSTGDYDKLKSYLAEISDTLDIDNYDCILYVSEQGCPTCTKSFDKIVKEYAFNKKRILIILNAKGHIFDVLPYINSGASNVVKDFTTTFYRLKFAATSCIITLKDKQVEEIIELKADKLDEQLNLLHKKVIESK